MLPSFCGEYFLRFNSFVPPELAEKLDENTDEEILGTAIALYESAKAEPVESYTFHLQWKQVMSYIYGSRSAAVYDRFFEIYPQEKALLHPVYR